MIRSGAKEGVPYSLSRWTDVPCAKWDWFRASLLDGKMQAFDPRNAVPDWWSLQPDDVHSLVFWTKNPKNLVLDYPLLSEFRVKAHVTITGWGEVEPGVPPFESVAEWTLSLADRIGAKNITWRFSPVPLLPAASLYERFESIARHMVGGTEEVFLSFLQENDKIPETRAREERCQVLYELASIADAYRIKLRLCNDDRDTKPGYHYNLSMGVCVPCGGSPKPQAEGCGCAIMVDPFTINETCTMGCQYCYAADKSLSPKKSNTTKGLVVIP